MQCNAHIFRIQPHFVACLLMWAFAIGTVPAATLHIEPTGSDEGKVKQATGTGGMRKHDKQHIPKASALTRTTNELMQKVFTYVERNGYDSLQYSSEVYLRHLMHTKRRGQIVRYIPGMLRLEQGINNYLSEAHLRFQYRQPGQVDCKIVAYHSTSRYQQPQRFNSIGRFNFHIYDSKLFIDCILNPLNARNRHFYRYAYLFTRNANDSLPRTSCIRIWPRFNNDQLVSGQIDINPETGAVLSFNFDFRYRMQHISIKAYMAREGYASMLPYQIHLVSTFKLLGNYVYEVTDINTTHRFSCRPHATESNKSRYDLTRECMLRIDTTRLKSDLAYFDSIRPYPLDDISKDILAKAIAAKFKSSDLHAPAFKLSDDFMKSTWETALEKVPHPRGEGAPAIRTSPFSEKESKDKPFISERAQNMLLSSHQFNLGNHSRLKLPAIITPSMVGWSGNKGFSLKTRLNWEYYHDSSNALPVLAIAPAVGYSFKQKQVYWELPFLLRFMPRYNGTFTFNAGGGAHMYNSRQADELRKKLDGIEKYDSLLHIIDHYGFHDYRDTRIQTDLGFSPTPGLRLTLGLRYHRRGLITWNELAQAAGMKRHFSSMGPRFQVEWTPAQYYYCEGKRRIPLYSPCPSLLFSYERGYAMGRGQTHYERFEADIRYRLPLYAMRTLYFRAGGGLYSQRGLDCFLDYDYFKFNYMPEEWNDDLSGEFQLLSSRWYNESRYYLRFTGTYESPMLLFSRIPYMSKVVQKERVYLNLLSVKALGFYSEIGYGISTHLLDFGTFVGIAPDHSFDFGCKVVLRFFDN